MYFITAEGQVSYNKSSGIQIHHIPIAVYTLGYTERDDTVFLQPTHEFKVPDIIYGNTETVSERIIKTFESRTVSTGVLLAGEKGSGKTLLAKVLSSKLFKKEIPTIIVNNKQIPISAIAQFLMSYKEQLFIIFDEFDKNYKTVDRQNELLSMLDGNVSSQNKLFAIIVNEVRDISEYLINRPGRLYYYIRYYGLDSSFIREYCEKELKDKTQIPDVEKIFSLYENVNFDMLKATIEEMNRYNEPIEEAIKFLNIESASSRLNINYNVIVNSGTGHKVFEGGIFYQPFNVDRGSFIVEFKDDNKNQIRIEFSLNDIVEYNRNTNTIYYLKNGYKAICTKNSHTFKASPLHQGIVLEDY